MKKWKFDIPFFFVDRPFYQDSISLENPNHETV